MVETENIIRRGITTANLTDAMKYIEKFQKVYKGKIHESNKKIIDINPEHILFIDNVSINTVICDEFYHRTQTFDNPLYLNIDGIQSDEKIWNDDGTVTSITFLDGSFYEQPNCTIKKLGRGRVFCECPILIYDIDEFMMLFLSTEGE